MIQTHTNEMSKKLGYKKTVSSTLIHETAIVSKHAEISPDVEIGPYCIVGANVKLKSGVKLYSHVHIDGVTEIGENTQIFPFAAIGFTPQDLKYAGEDSRVKIGKNNTIREYVTVHGGTKLGRVETVIGDNCLLMVSTHIAHDCIIGNNIVMSNNATIGGHAIIEDDVIIGGLAAIHQFVRVGKYAIIGGLSAVADDIVPYATVAGDRAKLLGVNTRGLRRHGFKNDDISAVHQAYDIIFRSSDDCFATRVHRVELEYQNNDTVLTIVKFLQSNKVRPICTPSK